MSRRRRRNTTVISLFPFLSILSCVIGTLTLLIAGMTAGEMGPPPEPERDYAEEYVRLLAERAVADEESDQVRLLIAQAEALAAKLAAARAELLRLQVLQQDTAAAEAEVIELASRLAAARADVEAARQTLAALHASIAQLKEQLASTRTLNEVARGRMLVRPPIARPGVEQRDWKPRFIECTALGLTLDLGEEEDKQELVPLEAIEESTAYGSLLRATRGQDDRIVIFLLRQGGVEALDAAISRAQDEKVIFAKVPAPGTARLDLSPFKSLQEDH